MKSTPTHEVRIYIAGPMWHTQEICRRVCMDQNSCVTVTPTTFIYNGVVEEGAVVGMIAYPRFPSIPEEIDQAALSLASTLLVECHQRSCTVATPKQSYYLENPNYNPKK